MRSVTPQELEEVLAKRPESVVLDVRTPGEFAELHVPQAHNLPLGELKPGLLRFEKNEPIYLLCVGGRRSQVAARQLAREGFSAVYFLEGGTLAWAEANLPVTRRKVEAISLDRQTRIIAGALVLGGMLLGGFVDRAFFGVSILAGLGELFAGLTDFCGLCVLLAKLPWNRRA